MSDILQFFDKTILLYFESIDSLNYYIEGQ